MKKFKHHKFTLLIPYKGNEKLLWSLVGPNGGISFWVSRSLINNTLDEIASLTFHYGQTSDYDRVKQEAPDILHCDLLKGPAWIDSSSLYATETLWPEIKTFYMKNDHFSCFSCLEHEYNTRIFPDKID